MRAQILLQVGELNYEASHGVCCILHPGGFTGLDPLMVTGGRGQETRPQQAARPNIILGDFRWALSCLLFQILSHHGQSSDGQSRGLDCQKHTQNLATSPHHSCSWLDRCQRLPGTPAPSPTACLPCSMGGGYENGNLAYCTVCQHLQTPCLPACPPSLPIPATLNSWPFPRATLRALECSFQMSPPGGVGRW